MMMSQLQQTIRYIVSGGLDCVHIRDEYFFLDSVITITITISFIPPKISDSSHSSSSSSSVLGEARFNLSDLLSSPDSMRGRQPVRLQRRAGGGGGDRGCVVLAARYRQFRKRLMNKIVRCLTFFCLWQARLPDQDVTDPTTDEEWQNKLISFLQQCDPPFPAAVRYKMQYCSTCHAVGKKSPANIFADPTKVDINKLEPTSHPERSFFSNSRSLPSRIAFLVCRSQFHTCFLGATC